MRVYSIYFSPTNSTKEIANLVANEVGSYQEIDLSKKEDMVDQVFENSSVLCWCRETDCIRNIDVASPCIDCSLYDLQEEIQFRPGRIFWREFNNFKF